jgi:heptosyltransferase I
VRVLIVRVGALGDVLHALPAAASLRKARPDAVIDWVVDGRWQPLLIGDDGGTVVRTALDVPVVAWKRSPFSWETVKDFLRFRTLRGQYDVVVDMQGTMRSSVIGRLAGGRKLVGYADPRESFAGRLYGRKIARLGTHVVDQGAALLGAACGLELTPSASELPHAQWADEWAAELVGEHKVCVLAPRAGWRAKQWSAEMFGALAKELQAMGFLCVVNAPRADDALAAEVVAHSDGAAEVVVCNVTGLIALIRRAGMLVGGDSGPTHLAAALGVPVVALFGPTSPARNGPWGAGKKVVVRDAASVTSYKRRSERDPGMERISVDRVLAAVKSLI